MQNIQTESARCTLFKWEICFCIWRERGKEARREWKKSSEEEGLYALSSETLIENGGGWIGSENETAQDP